LNNYFGEAEMTTKTHDRTIITTVIIAIVSLLLSAYIGYSHNDKDISNRMVTVETQQKNDEQALIRIENQVDKTNLKIDRLVEWALGK
jgi:hypothetical protein